MKLITNKNISNALSSTNRIYLAGKLSGANPIEHFNLEDFEIGISDYKDFTIDKPHYHSFNHEYNFILNGEIKVFVIDEKKEYLLKEGDIFLIEPNMKYITKSKKGTRVLFMKSPGGNDKVEIDKEGISNEWFEKF